MLIRGLAMAAGLVLAAGCSGSDQAPGPAGSEDVLHVRPEPDASRADIQRVRVADVSAPADPGRTVGPGPGELPAGFLEPCNSAADCAEGFCIPVDDRPTDFVCTIPCLDSCPLDWSCKGVAGTEPEVVFICVPPVDRLCDPCEEHLDCNIAGDLCIDYPDGGRCGQDCTATGTCPGDYFCVDVYEPGVDFGPPLARQCVPRSGSCDCAPGTDYTSDPFHCGRCGKMCIYENGVGVCHESQCILGSCDAGFADLDGEDENGCEYPCPGDLSDDDPDVQGIDNDCDGVDGVAADSVFVARQGYDDANTSGNRANPFRSLAAALDFAEANGRMAVLVAEGTWEERVQVRPGVSIYGGYRAPDPEGDPRSGWKRDLDRFETIIRWSNPDGFGRVVTVVADGVTTDTTLQALTIEAGNNTTPSGPSMAIEIRNSGSGLVFERVRVVAGGGGAGQSGEPGAPGLDGVLGAAGTAAEGGDCFCDDREGRAGFGGDGGVRSCPSLNASGGRGGDSACDRDCASVGFPAAVSDPPRIGSGGAGGCDRLAGDIGRAGSPGVPGTDGEGGDGLGTVNSAGRWLASSGSDGTDGTDGTGGGGGGGGSGADPNGIFGCAWWGGGGGGGGAGGCGGTGGRGGTGGGASFAAYVFNASPTLRNVVLVRGAGGNGGAGGDGGRGGERGLGGVPGLNSSGAPGGLGGSGGEGGFGGHGGGGGGGPSVGLFVTGSGQPTCVLVRHDVAGSSGVGGVSAGQRGEDGRSKDAHGAPMECLP